MYALRLLCIAAIAMLLKDLDTDLFRSCLIIGCIFIRDVAIYLELQK